jgi:transposase
MEVISMTRYREILRLHAEGISSRNIGASCECSRNTVAKVLSRAAELNISWPLSEGTTDGDLEEQFFPKSNPSSRRIPDLEYLHKELMKQGVSLKLLWTEYCEGCRREKEIPLQYSQFCYHYQTFAQKKRASMHVPRKPGEQTEVDWAGQTAGIIDRDTGALIPVYVFVATLSYSQYAYVEGFLSQNQEHWIAAHVHMFQFFQGITRIIVPDNLKTGVQTPDWYSPVINRTYHEMAEYYNTAIIPARVRKPKDKPNAERTVGVISTWIIAALRHRQFFSLGELNEEIRERLNEFNGRDFQKKTGSRLSVFLGEEKPMLRSLPAAPFELAFWKQATVQFNYHISVEKNHYSVPYEYIRQKVDVRITERVIEVFFNHTRICSHPRMWGKIGYYSTSEAHMPTEHREYASWNAERFTSWAQKIGPNAMATVKAILAAHKIEQQGYRSCMGLLKLADKYSVTRLEAACRKALSYTPHPSLKSVRTILSTGQDRVPDDTQPLREPNSSSPYGFTRGAAYYGRNER